MTTDSRRGMPSAGKAMSAVRAININASAQKVEVDNRISLHYYYRIADNLLRQASIYREEKNLIDLYIILLRFSSLMCETIPSHRDYQVLLPKAKTAFRKRLLNVIDELEALKPIVQHQVDEINRESIHQIIGLENNSFDSSFGRKQLSSSSFAMQPHTKLTSDLSQKQTMERNQVKLSENLIDAQFKKLNFNLPYPKEDTLSRHSILGPGGLQGQWTGPISGIRVQYPSNVEFTHNEIPRLNQEESHDTAIMPESHLKGRNSDMESVLTLDDGNWPITGDPSSMGAKSAEEELLQLNIRQPSIPPVFAQVQPAPFSISPSKVADPRPGPPKSSQEGFSKTYQKLHVPIQMLECFLKLAESNTTKNLETCGVLAGLLKNSTFVMTTLIIPKQESTSDSCQTTDEEEIFNVQDQRSLFPLGWIHTHPTQTCFMSSIDLHTHYSYQIMLPEAIAIVMAPTDPSRNHGIFHLSEPSGVSIIRNCHERGFHPHEESTDGSSIYEHCSHVLMNTNLKFDVVDLRSL